MGKCVHCFKELVEVTRDHIFPSSWYTDNTQQNIQRLTVPSCRECNEKFGKLEQKLFMRLVPCIDPTKAEMSGITKKLFHTYTKNPRFLKWLKENLKPYTKDKKPFPGLGPHEGFPLESQSYIPAPVDLLPPVLEKIFRGLEYKFEQRLMKEPYALKIYHVFEEPEEIKKLLSHKSKKDISFGPGFSVERIVPTNMKEPVIYKTIIWGTFISYASVVKKR